jgi:predicted enzyme related to lactoylglutathione lyase
MASDTPRLFRINVEVGDIDRAAAFYSELLGLEARPQMGSRVYLDAGAVTLQVVQVPAPHPAAKALYFAVGDLDALHARAAALGCLSGDSVHGTPAGQPVVRPWGERSFYADDPWGNPLCFVDESTVYAG